MTKSELIEALKPYPDDMKIFIVLGDHLTSPRLKQINVLSDIPFCTGEVVYYSVIYTDSEKALLLER